jgi:hypothetical protein
MRRQILLAAIITLFSTSLLAQNKRLWILRTSGEAVEYDASNFAQKQSVKIPAEAAAAPSPLSVNSLGQMLFAAPVNLPLSEEDSSAEGKMWFWDGHQANVLTREVTRNTAKAGSNLSINEFAATPSLSADGKHLFWFANQARRLQRDGVDLSTKNTSSAWRTNLDGSNREDLVSAALPDCSCPTGGCEETCAYGEVWVPANGVDNFFVLTQLVAGQTKPLYQSTSVYQENAGKWLPAAIDPPLRNILDAASPGAILEAVPDTGCCGWSNESDDKTLLHLQGKTVTLFDELGTYKNPDYDVSFYAQNGKFSPNLKSVALTIVATSKPNTPIQLAQQGQANPAESQSIRKALAELPAVEIQTVEDISKKVAMIPHATLIGWLSDQEILMVEGGQLVAYNVATAARRKSSIQVEDPAYVVLR